MITQHTAFCFLFLNSFILRSSEFILKGNKMLNHKKKKKKSMTILVALVKGFVGNVGRGKRNNQYSLLGL